MMTLDFGNYYSDTAVQYSELNSYELETVTAKRRKSQTTEQELDYGRNDEERWENEGGAYLARFGLVPGINRLVAEDDTFITHIKNFDDALDREEYDVAAAELNAAADIYSAFQSIVTHCFDDAISHLTTLGGPASPPHPLALPLIRKRESFAG